MHQPSDHPDAQAKAPEPDPKVAEPSDVADASADPSPKPAPTDSIEVAAKESPEPAPVQAAAAPPEALRASVPSAVPARKGGVSPPTQVTTNLKAGGARQRSEPPSEGAEALWGGRVRILDELGRGAMGTVLRAQDVKLQRELALKVASTPRNQMPPALLARFVEEVQITAQLEHPNVVPVHDLGIDPDGRAYFSMKLVHGQSLEEILDKRAAGDQKTLGEFGLRRLLDVFLQVCQAIEYAHARGVIHRDLKPANIMVGDFGEVLVMDWGVAKLLGHSERDDFSDQISQTGNESVPPGSAKDTSAPRSAKQSIAPRSAKQSIPPRTAKESIAPSDPVRSVRGSNQAFATQRGALIGTPAYMSPEQAAGRPADQRSDVYSLGVILFEILCGQVPFDDDDPKVVVARVLEQQPPRPSEIKRAVPPGLETLCLRLLEKDPAQRTITIPTIRAHVHNYIEGIGRDYGRESLWTTVGWSVGAFLLFAFLVWYLTGEPVAVVLALGPPAFLNAVGWFLVVLALGYPLWAIYAGFRQSRVPADRFKPPDPAQIFVSGYLAHRTFAASVAPLFQLIFIIELITVAVVRASRGALRSMDLVQQLSDQMRAEWAQALIVMAIFLFAYLFLLSTEVRFARKVERYESLVDRQPWESVWPFFLIGVLLLTVATTDVLDWILSSRSPTLMGFVRQQLMAPALSFTEMSKSLVFQGTFLLGLVAATLFVSFPFAEVLASFRMAYQAADEAAVASRWQYFLRSLATFRLVRTNCLYGGALIASLTAMSMLSDAGQRPLIEKVLYILGPSFIGFIGYQVLRGYVRSYLARTPAVRQMVDYQLAVSREEQERTNLDELEIAPLRWRLFGLLVPVVCVLIYLLWTGSGIHQQVIARLIMPVTTKGWLLILPYAFLVPLLLIRDPLERRALRRKFAPSQSESTGEVAGTSGVGEHPTGAQS